MGFFNNCYDRQSVTHNQLARISQPAQILRGLNISTLIKRVLNLSKFIVARSNPLAVGVDIQITELPGTSFRILRHSLSAMRGFGDGVL
jgi:hypothetical protein